MNIYYLVIQIKILFNIMKSRFKESRSEKDFLKILLYN